MSSLYPDHFNLDECDQACHECIKQYNEKYSKSTKVWDIPCKGIPKKYLSKEELKGLSPELQKRMLGVLDPVTWASIEFNWEPRWYQTLMLRCTAQNRVSRLGRQSGKSESLAILALWLSFTRKNHCTVILTPMKEHTELFFKRLNQYIKKSPGLDNSVIRNVRAPSHEIVLANGSVIKGFTAGTKSGGEADITRGQTVDLLIFDEADMLASADMDSAFATITDRPDAFVWVSSTPKGKREKFYKCCVESPSFKEFHYPSQVNPNWGERQEKFFKAILTKLGYVHEISALFGEQAEGVFQAKYVDMAKTDYLYANEKPQPGWLYCVGVDWNDVAIGTRIRVVGYNMALNKFRVVDKHTVSRQGWNSVLAIQKVREVNQLWNPSWIYVDNRPSPAHVEMLKLYGLEAAKNPNKGKNHPDARLKDIVKGYEFGSKIDSYDMFTKEQVKRPAKVFLIENAVRRFEAGQIEFSNEDKELEAQLLGYIIDRWTANGQPVYKAGNKEAGDHDIDAVALALIGFTLELTTLGSPRYNANISLIEEPLGVSIPDDDEKSNIFSVKVVRDKKKRLRDERERLLPQVNRTAFTETSFTGESLPAANSTIEAPQRLWSHPGWGHDAPAPKRATRRGSFRKGGMPKRSNI